ncbi:MAG: flavin reductase family protein [Verrucomicrobia bacterium]|nr:flavin reductase family protein [Verrucomicrobiota bacterium]
MKKSLGPRTLLHPTPVLAIGTYAQDGQPNVMTASWAGLCCSMPPCVAVSLRKATYSYGNIVRRKAFTVSLPSEQHVKHADFFGLITGRGTDKFAASGLTAVPSDKVDAPYVDEFPLVLECELLHTLEIGLHTLFVGEILNVLVDEKVLTPEGMTDLKKLQPLVFQPDLQAYYGIGECVGQAFSIGEKLQE